MSRLTIFLSIVSFSSMLAACDGDDTKEPVTIGMATSLTGSDMLFGIEARQVAEAALAEINAQGGANGHELVLAVEDDETDGPAAEAAVQALIDAGAVGIIGPFSSFQVEPSIDNVRAAQVPLISPSSTNPALLLIDDDGYLFRTAPNDNFQVLAMSHYFRELSPDEVTDIMIVGEDSGYGVGLADALTEEWVNNRGLAMTDTALEFTPDMTTPAAEALWAQIVAADPDVVVFIGFGTDSNLMLRTWNDSGQLPDLTWFLADGAKEEAIFGVGGTLLPDTAIGIRGTAPTSPSTSIAFTTFVEIVLEQQEIDVSQEAYMSNTWDATYLMAAAIAKQSVDEGEVGGPGLRDALQAVSKGGQIFHAGQWRDISAQIAAGNDVDYDGASGPVDFTGEASGQFVGGEVLSPYEVYELQQEAGDWVINQVHYIETLDLLE